MPGRGYEANIVSQAAGDHVRFIWFGKVELDSGTQYLHTGTGTLTWDSQDWEGLGDLVGVTPIQEGSAISSYPIDISLSGIDDALKESDFDFLNAINTEDVYGRGLTIYVGAYDADTDALVADPVERWSGLLQTPRAQIGAQNVINTPAESEMAIFDQSNGARYSDSDLQDEYAGDLGFQYLDQVIDKRVVWRGRNANAWQGQPGPPKKANPYNLPEHLL